jgi:hypothetical protein
VIPGAESAREGPSLIAAAFFLRYGVRMSTSNAARTIIGIDPGLAHTGWGILRVERSRLRYGRTGLSPPRRGSSPRAPRDDPPRARGSA